MIARTLAIAVMGVRPRRARPHVIFAMAIGLTLAQPFGVTANRIRAGEYAHERAAAVSITGWHVMPVGPLGIVPFHVYRHDKLALADSAPSSPSGPAPGSGRSRTARA